MGARTIEPIVDVHGPYPPDMRIINPYSFASGGGGGGFAPNDIAGLKFWLPQNEFALSDNDPIGAALDFSGQGNDAAASGSVRPTFKTNILNGLPMMLFSGAQTLATAAPVHTSVTYTLFMVVQSTTTGGVRVPLYNGNASAGGYGPLILSSNRTVLHGGQATFADGSATTNWEIWTVVRGATVKFYLNGVEESLSGSTSLEPMAVTTASYVGGTDSAGANGWDGYIGDPMIFDNEISAPDHASLVAWAQNKYAL